MQNKICCVFGHRTINLTVEQIKTLKNHIEMLITEENINTFIFGSKSQFNDLCHNLVSQLREKYPHIKRIYIRAEYPYIAKKYEEYLLGRYESTCFPERIINAGKARYVERNYIIIQKSDICLVYYEGQENFKSGTYKAYKYAEKNQRRIINAFDLFKAL